MEIMSSNFQDAIRDPKNFARVSLQIGIPAYGGALNLLFVQSLLGLTGLLGQCAVRTSLMMIGSDSLIPRARNAISNQFYFESNCSHLLFLDADIRFDPLDILTMIASRKELVALPYSKKSISWDRVYDAARAGTPAELLPIVGANDPCVTLLADGARNTDSIIEVESVGCGLMLIARSTLEKLEKSYTPERRYKLFPPQVERLRLAGSKRDYELEFFRSGVGENGNYSSEDFMFCSDFRQIGGAVHLVPWARTSHIGHFSFVCDLRVPMPKQQMKEVGK